MRKLHVTDNQACRQSKYAKSTQTAAVAMSDQLSSLAVRKQAPSGDHFTPADRGPTLCNGTEPAESRLLARAFQKVCIRALPVACS